MAKSRGSRIIKLHYINYSEKKSYKKELVYITTPLPRSSE